MDETKVANQDTLQTTGQSSGEAKAGSTSRLAKTYTEEQRRQAVSDALADAGRRHETEIKRLTSERDSFSQIAAELAEAKANIDSLTTEIDELSKDDPDKTDLVKLRKEAKAKLATLTAQDTALKDREAKVQKFERDRLIAEIADSYTTANGEDADPDSLLKAADKFKISDRAGLESLAEEKGWKLKTTTEEESSEPSAPDNGKSSGGGEITEEDKLKKRYPSMYPKK